MSDNAMRERARRYRAMAPGIDDELAKKALLDLAAEYETLVERAEASEGLGEREHDK